MTWRCGVDIVHIPSLAKKLERRAFLNKIYHRSECEKWTAQSMAGVAAAKEAFFKALGLRPRWMDVTVERASSGRPSLLLTPSLRKEHRIADVDVSISHDRDYAIAQVIVKHD